MEAYFDALNKEILNFSKDNDKKVETIYFGGGTPSFVDSKYISKILETINKNYDTSEVKEVTLEANPEYSSEFKTYKELGINRLSLGIQSLDDSILKLLGRIHNADTAKKALEKANEYFNNVSGDLIIGVTKEQNSLEDAKYIKDYVKHISMYMLSVDDATPLMDMINKNEYTILDDDSMIDKYNEMYHYLENEGFLRYETSNFAKDGYKAIHNCKYWDLSNYIGFGASAHSYVDDKRFHNVSNINSYIEKVNLGDGSNYFYDRNSSKYERNLEYIMLALRTTKGIDLEEYKKLFNKDFLEEFNVPITALKPFYDVDDKHVAITPNFFLVQNKIIGKTIRFLKAN